MGDAQTNTGWGRVRRFDAGWLYLAAGGVVFGAVALIPADEDAAAAEAQVVVAGVWADHEAHRLERYAEYLDALERQDPTLIASLAAMNLRLAPAGKQVLPIGSRASLTETDASLFDEIEPPAPASPTPPEPVDSILAKLARGERSRLALAAGAVLCMLIGLLPPVRGSR